MAKSKRMLNRALALAAFGLALLGIPSASNATVWNPATISLIYVDQTTSCFFFQLNGVTQADPIAPSDPWFAVPNSSPNLQSIVSMLITAKATNRSLQVVTTGATSCLGHAAVASVELL
jgi:hypothetical protein